MNRQISNLMQYFADRSENKSAMLKEAILLVGEWAIILGKLLFLVFWIYAILNFMYELSVYQAAFNSMIPYISAEQKVLENINLGLMDLKLILAAIGLIFYIKFIKI